MPPLNRLNTGSTSTVKTAARKERIRYVVLQRKPRAGASDELLVHGPYASFRRAEGDAKAWEADGSTCSVEPLVKVR